MCVLTVTGCGHRISTLKLRTDFSRRFYTTKNDGMGIGLSVSRSIIESHHGRLWATLNNGPGAAFSFSIPCAPEGATDADGDRAIQTPGDVTDAA